MQYLALIYARHDAETTGDSVPEEMARYAAFEASAQAQDALLGGNALLPTSTATSVRVRDGEILLTDGPFAETREQLGGYYLLECADLDQAIALAAQIPAAAYGTIEVRPIMTFPER